MLQRRGAGRRGWRAHAVPILCSLNRRSRCRLVLLLLVQQRRLLLPPLLVLLLLLVALLRLLHLLLALALLLQLLLPLDVQQRGRGRCRGLLRPLRLWRGRNWGGRWRGRHG